MNRPKRGEIFWADLRPVTGSEQGGFRPVLILSNNTINKFSPVVVIAPLTRYDKSDTSIKVYPTDAIIDSSDIAYIDGIVEKLKEIDHSLNINSDSKLYTDQSRSISVKRLTMKIGDLRNIEKLESITDKIAEVFAVTGCNVCFTPMKPNQLKCGNPECRKRHRKKCRNCEEVLPLRFRYCFNCGKGA